MFRHGCKVISALLLTLVASALPGPVQADYCVYFVISGFFGLNPPVNAGDIICVDCPDSAVCPGPAGTNFTATIVDIGGTSSTGQLRKDVGGDSCTSCPPNGKTGYHFVGLAPVPALPTWGYLTLVIVALASGTVLLRRGSPQPS